MATWREKVHALASADAREFVTSVVGRLVSLTPTVPWEVLAADVGSSVRGDCHFGAALHGSRHIDTGEMVSIAGQCKREGGNPAKCDNIAQTYMDDFDFECNNEVTRERLYIETHRLPAKDYSVRLGHRRRRDERRREIASWRAYREK